MLRSIMLLAVLLTVSYASRHASEPRTFHGLIRNKSRPLSSYVTSPMPHTYIKASDIPTNFSWASVNGTNYLTPARNQHIPQYCGSCWAMSATSALADRLKIQRNAQFPDYEIAVQTVVYCAGSGCSGADLDTAYQFIKKNNGIGLDTCQNYVALGDGNECTAIHQCQNCMPGKPCWAMTTYPKVQVAEHGSILGEQQMMAEIFARGPIVCGIDANPIVNWYMPQASGVFTGGAGDNSIDHAISVVGFGEEGGIPYWLIRNSWGEYWGDNGYFKLQRGGNHLGIEQEQCTWAVPKM